MSGKNDHRVDKRLPCGLADVLKQLRDLPTVKVKTVPEVLLFGLAKSPAFDLAFDLVPGLKGCFLDPSGHTKTSLGKWSLDKGVTDAPSPDRIERDNFLFDRGRAQRATSNTFFAGSMVYISLQVGQLP